MRNKRAAASCIRYQVAAKLKLLMKLLHDA
jgi:hypothetical protein